MSPQPETTEDAVALVAVRTYHEGSKHRFEAYAESPGQLDWDAQPAPFRHYAGAATVDLPLAASRFERPYAQLATPATPAAPDLDSLGALLQLSFALSAWKSWGPSRWTLRCNPSSGNLHPTEVYLFISGLPGLADGVHHYDPLQHRLELRAALATLGAIDATPRPPQLAVAFTSVMWREAWKYGERAFRYCQLDTGHAIGALAYAAALLGWTPQPVAVASERLGHWLGLDREQDLAEPRHRFTEVETPELLFDLRIPGTTGRLDVEAFDAALSQATWHGTASVIDPDPGYRWPVIDQVAAASAFDENPALPLLSGQAHEARRPPLQGEGWGGDGEQPAGMSHELRRSSPHPPPGLPLDGGGDGVSDIHALALPPLPPHPTRLGAAALMQQRRSGQRFDPALSAMSQADFFRLLDALLPRPQAPWQALATPPRIHLALFVLRVAGLAPGLYLLPRRAGVLESPDAMPVAGCPPHLAHLGLVCLAEMELKELQRIARAVSCHQDIASSSTFSLAMLGEFDAALATGPHGYRELFHEAGLVGQALYLEAEAAGLRGTGIGCYFDDAVHQVFGLDGTRLQSMYHFTVGHPVVDSRIETGPPYPERDETA